VHFVGLGNFLDKVLDCKFLGEKRLLLYRLKEKKIYFFNLECTNPIDNT